MAHLKSHDLMSTCIISAWTALFNISVSVEFYWRITTNQINTETANSVQLSVLPPVLLFPSRPLSHSPFGFRPKTKIPFSNILCLAANRISCDPLSCQIFSTWTVIFTHGSPSPSWHKGIHSFLFCVLWQFILVDYLLVVHCLLNILCPLEK